MIENSASAPYLIDVSRLLWRAWRGQLPTGIDRTCLAYIGRYGGRARAVIQRGGHTRILSMAASRRLFDSLLVREAGIRFDFVRLVLAAMLVPPLCERRARGCLYFNVGHTGLDRPGHAKWIEATGVKPIYFVHDLIPLTHPEYCRSGQPEKHLRRVLAMLANGAGIIGNSRDTLNELAIFVGLQRSLHMPATLVAPLGTDPAAIEKCSHAMTSLLPGRPYFVLLGTIEGRKNHLLILNLWADMARRLGTECPQLVIIGQRGWECEQVVDMLERCKALRGHVIELPHCEDTQLSAYLANARALLFPSFVEGYGLPLVEALGHGTPVIASDLAVFRELAGDIPDYLSPIDGLGWMRTIEAYASDERPDRAAQLSRLTGWRAPTWEAHFAKVDQWLAQLS